VNEIAAVIPGSGEENMCSDCDIVVHLREMA